MAPTAAGITFVKREFGVELPQLDKGHLELLEFAFSLLKHAVAGLDNIAARQQQRFQAAAAADKQQEFWPGERALKPEPGPFEPTGLKPE